jgi:hypothetical protein
MSVNWQIGFHTLFDPSTRRESMNGNAVLVVYDVEMGLPYAAVAWIGAKRS